MGRKPRVIKSEYGRDSSRVEAPQPPLRPEPEREPLPVGPLPQRQPKSTERWTLEGNNRSYVKPTIQNLQKQVPSSRRSSSTKWLIVGLSAGLGVSVIVISVILLLQFRKEESQPAGGQTKLAKASPGEESSNQEIPEALPQSKPSSPEPKKFAQESSNREPKIEEFHKLEAKKEKPIMKPSLKRQVRTAPFYALKRGSYPIIHKPNCPELEGRPLEELEAFTSIGQAEDGMLCGLCCSSIERECTSQNKT
jgi:hypothetical protein